jgi:RecA-family ATPase
MADKAQFINLWSAGFRRLVPIVPPDAALSPQSSLARRPNAVGKAPGIKGFDGLWRGLDWLKHDTKESDLDTWAAMGAGVGIRTGSGIAAVDVDTKNKDLCVTIAGLIQSHFGNGCIRVGDSPKFLVVFRAQDEIPYERVEFSDGLNKPDGTPQRPRVEILTEGRQFVAEGVHPVTRKPYQWPRGIKPLEQLPTISAAQVHKFFEALADTLPAAHRPVIEASSKETPPQHTLVGRYEHVKKAVSALPNTIELFPTYDDYVRVGAAIKASLPDDQDAAQELFLQWAARWEGGDFAPDKAIADFRRIKAPYRLGANWLYQQADRYAPTPQLFSHAEVFFQPVTDADIERETDIFAQADVLNRKREAQDAAIVWIDPKEWDGRTPPARKWIVNGLVPAAEVTLLTGAGGVGKTLLAQQMCTSISAGLPFLGAETTQERTLLFLCEDDENELNRRQRDINAALCLSLADLSGRMRIASRKHADNLLVTFDRQNGKMTRTPLWHALMRTVEEYQPGLVVVDTSADVFGGSEIDRQQVRQFIQAGLGAFAQATGCAVLLLAHPSRAGEASGEGTSGSTAWHASVRSRLYLQHATKDGRGPFRKLQSKKANYGPAGSEWTLLWDKGAFSVHTASTVGTALSEGAPDKAVSLREAIKHAAVDLATRERPVPTSLARNSPNFAAKVMRAMHHEMLGMYEASEIAEAIEALVRDGVLSLGEIGRTAKRMPIMGLLYKGVGNSDATDEGQDVFE